MNILVDLQGTNQGLNQLVLKLKLQNENYQWQNTVSWATTFKSEEISLSSVRLYNTTQHTQYRFFRRNKIITYTTGMSFVYMHMNVNIPSAWELDWWNKVACMWTLEQALLTVLGWVFVILLRKKLNVQCISKWYLESSERIKRL